MIHSDFSRKHDYKNDSGGISSARERLFDEVLGSATGCRHAAANKSGDSTNVSFPGSPDAGSGGGESGERVPLISSLEEAKGTNIGATDPNKIIEVTFFLKPDQDAINGYGQKRRLTHEEYAAMYSAPPESMMRVVKFAEQNGLTVADVEPSERIIQVKGKVGDFDRAFQMQLQDYQRPEGVAREFDQLPTVPKELKNVLEGVLGLDDNLARFKPIGPERLPDSDLAPRNS